jgi:16S rRNA (guanine527-N7)-methyltransferase
VSSSPLPDLPEVEGRLRAILEQARTLGFLGPGPIQVHLDNAAGFAGAIATPPHRGLDLGSGGGVPGLALALRWPASSWVLLDAMRRRCTFLTAAIEELGISGRVEVREDRAESAGRAAGLRGAFDLVTARSFARPAVTAECGAPFLQVGGWLLVSEPPQGGARWEQPGVLGLDDRGVVAADAAHIRRLEQVVPCPDRYPRRVGVPEKRPLW